ncbi:unnamed protein product [Paramecium sonneborni]|uniref:VWFA domain-containing protein n=1 Tax=Paramecium sonneborni TaxID=65129 RepID=A0A8S1LNV7_9CILI|nr:unnamed protein product [Paramecium sonneborni]
MDQEQQVQSLFDNQSNQQKQQEQKPIEQKPIEQKPIEQKLIEQNNPFQQIPQSQIPLNPQIPVVALQQYSQFQEVFPTPHSNQNRFGGSINSSQPPQQQFQIQFNPFSQQQQYSNANLGMYQQNQINPLNQNLFGSPFNYQQAPQQLVQSQSSLFGIPDVQYDNFKIKYDDDEMIEPKKEQVKQSNEYNLNEKISFEVKALYKMGKLLNTKSQYLPGIVSIKAQEKIISENDKNGRVGVDLICLIDISGSMIGIKIEMVKQSLIILLQFLGDNDRLQLITFDNEAHKLTPLKRVTLQNKDYFTQIIKSIQAYGGNQISEATKMAFQQLKQRKYVNNVTSIFLLSDGVDYTFPAIQTQIKSVNEIFTLHTFGFGQDHDAPMMTSICNLKSGSFYFVQDVTLLDEFFADALGGLISVVGENLEINISSSAPAPYQNIQISKTYGNMWKKKGNQYQITQPQLASGSRKDYVFELLLPQFEAKIEDSQRNVKVIDAQLIIRDPTNGNVIKKQDSITLTFFNLDEQINQNEQDIDVYAQYFRVKGTEVIDQARKACEQNKNEDAQKLIDNMLIQIQKNQNVAAQCGGIIQDLQQAKQASERQSYNLFGQKQMCQMISNNYQQQGVNSMFSAQGFQVQQVQPASYQNIQQQAMMGLVQQSKQPYKKN